MEAIPFDRSVLKVNQVILMVGLVGGYFAGLAFHGAVYVLPALAAMMLAGTASPRTNLARLFYLRVDRKSTRLNSSHYQPSRMPSSA